MSPIMRSKVGPLPPWKPMSRDELLEKTPLVRPGEWYGIDFPTTVAQIAAKEFGAAWLTKALHKAGTLPINDAVTAIKSVNELPWSGLDAQGGAGHKAIITVEYASGGGNGLHEKLFVKMPWTMEANEKYRVLLSGTANFGPDTDGTELSVYQFLEGKVK